MANELRHEHLFVQDSGAAVQIDRVAEFRNDSAELMHIRELDIGMVLVQVAAAGAFGSCEMGKSPTLEEGTNNGVFFRRSATATANAIGQSGEKKERHKYAKGQLTLEPNESLFMNLSKVANETVNGTADIGYHY